MGHLPDLIRDLALILIAGAITTFIFRWIKQPLVLGYIIAGFLVGPHFHLLPTVADNENIGILAEIGVIFLLFSLGLEFSFRRLLRVGGPATPVANKSKNQRAQSDTSFGTSKTEMSKASNASKPKRVKARAERSRAPRRTAINSYGNAQALASNAVPGAETGWQTGIIGMLTNPAFWH